MKLAPSIAALVIAAVPSADALKFGVKEGTKLEKHFEMKMDLEKRSMSISIGGQELPSELSEQAVMQLTFAKSVDVADEYKKVDGERPLQLVRHFEELADTSTENVQMPGMEDPKEEKKSKESKLAGKTVLFRWDAEKEAYAKEWVGEGADDELLEGLKEDMDLRRILPSKSVAEGDTWEIDLKEFGDLLGPGGKFGFEGDDDDDDSDFEDNMKGEATCTYKGTREVEGRKLARIAAVCKATTFQDKEEEKDGSKMHMTFDLDLEGEFLWDVAAKRLASYELDGTVKALAEITQELEMQGESHELLVKIDLGGKVEVEGKLAEK